MFLPYLFPAFMFLGQFHVSLVCGHPPDVPPFMFRFPSSVCIFHSDLVSWSHASCLGVSCLIPCDPRLDSRQCMFLCFMSHLHVWCVSCSCLGLVSCFFVGLPLTFLFETRLISGAFVWTFADLSQRFEYNKNSVIIRVWRHERGRAVRQRSGGGGKEEVALPGDGSTEYRSTLAPVYSCDFSASP